ncbi:MAG TPA: multidrug effflux MFS transporter [Steroidobacteraceae bacterium]|nr:multidrug effflux MFS transporter [Steroidobacteraceae bacterium]
MVGLAPIQRTVTERQPAAAPAPRLALILALLSTLGSYTIDAFFPSMRAMAEEFGISYWQVQQTLTVYLVPYACMSLVHGSVSDAIGRRRVVLVGLVLYAVASMGCALAPGFGALLFCRALQGMVGGVGMIIGRAVVRDCYSGAQAQRVMSAITIMFSLGPALAPVIGGWIHVWLGWRAVFASMAVYALVLAWTVYRKLPETLGLAQRTPLEFGALAGNLWAVARHAEFLLLTTASALCFVVLQIYVGSAPAIILDHWHGTETGFAMLTVPIIAGYAMGAVASGRMAGRLPPARQANYGYTLLLAATGAMLVLQVFVGSPPILAQQLLLTSMAFGLQLLFPIITLRILDLFGHSRGAATSAHTFFLLVLAALMMGDLAPWLSQSMERLALTAFIFSVAGWCMWRVARWYQRRFPVVFP